MCNFEEQPRIILERKGTAEGEDKKMNEARKETGEKVNSARKILIAL